MDTQCVTVPQKDGLHGLGLQAIVVEVSGTIFIGTVIRAYSRPATAIQSSCIRRMFSVISVYIKSLDSRPLAAFSLLFTRNQDEEEQPRK